MYTIKQFAQKLRIRVSTIRYYERAGLLAPEKGENGYRLYHQKELDQVRYILVMKYANFSIEEMKLMFSLMETAVIDDCHLQTGQLIHSKEQEISQKIARFNDVLDLLKKLKPLTAHHEFEEVQPQLNAEIDMIFQKIMAEEN